MNDDDTKRIAGTVRLAGDLLDAHGGLLLELLDSWRNGPRSPNLDPDAGGWRYEEIIGHDGNPETVPVPSDSTGESALRGDPNGALMQETTALLKRLSSDAARLRDIISSAVPPSTGAVGNSTEDWCSNHLTIQQCEPRHRGDLCRFCYEFKLVHRQYPPPSLLGLRHRYGRVTSEQVSAALSRERSKNDSLERVSEAVRKGRRKVPPPVQPKPTPEPERDPADDIADRRRKRMSA